MVNRPHQTKQLGLRTMMRGLLAVAVGLLAVIVSFAYSSQLARAFTLATSHLPEGYTQLYFVDQTQLPEHVKTAAVSSFSFDITNDEGQWRTYSYEVTQTSSSGMVSYIADGQVILQNGGSVVVPVKFELKVPRSSAQLKVSLLKADGQEIDFRSQT